MEREQSRLQSRSLWLFLLITFAFSWIFWIPKALATQGLMRPSFLTRFLLSPFNPAAFGPAVGAFTLTYLEDGKKGVIRLLKRAIDYRIDKKWWIPTIFLMPVIIGGALLLSLFSGESMPELFWISNPMMIVVSFFWILFLGGPLQEEFGWRGYALDRLQARWSALLSSIFLGTIWFAWHLPMFWITDELIYGKPMVGFWISDVFLAILMTWLYNNTNGSILVAMIFHAMFNLSVFIFPALETDMGSLYFLIGFIIVVSAVIIIWGPKRLTRKKHIERNAMDRR